jgi:predicted N-acetyltransferase YhbS
MKVIPYHESQVRADQHFEIMKLIFAVWPLPDSSPEQWVKLAQDSWRNNERPDLRRFVIWEASKAIAHGQIFLRTIKWPEKELTVTALAGVCVDPVHQGKGLGKAIVRTALAEANKSDNPVVLFQTDVVEFYLKLGAREIFNRFYNSKNRGTPDANPWWASSVMVYPSTCDFPPGDIDLNGPGY